MVELSIRTEPRVSDTIRRAVLAFRSILFPTPAGPGAENPLVASLESFAESMGRFAWTDGGQVGPPRIGGLDWIGRHQLFWSMRCFAGETIGDVLASFREETGMFRVHASISEPGGPSETVFSSWVLPEEMGEAAVASASAVTTRIQMASLQGSGL